MACTPCDAEADILRFIGTSGDQPLESSIAHTLSLFRRRQICSPEASAVATAQLLLRVVKFSRWANAAQLQHAISSVGRQLVLAHPQELVIGNIVRLVLGMIREEAAEQGKDASNNRSMIHEAEVFPDHETGPLDITQPYPFGFKSHDNLSDSTLNQTNRLMQRPTLGSTKSLFNLLSVISHESLSPVQRLSGASTPSTPFSSGAGQAHTHIINSLRSEVAQRIQDQIQDINIDNEIANWANVYINEGDTVLLCKPCLVVQKFVLRAAQSRKFQVFLIQKPSRLDGYSDIFMHSSTATFRQKLITLGVKVTLLLSTGLIAYMPAVSKSVLGCRAVLANGDVVVDSGLAVVAKASKDHGCPVAILTETYKLSPHYPHHEDSLIEWGNPSNNASFTDGPLIECVQIRHTLTEILPSEWVDVFVTSEGQYSRHHIPMIISENYDDGGDMDLHMPAWY